LGKKDEVGQDKNVV